MQEDKTLTDLINRRLKELMPIMLVVALALLFRWSFGVVYIRKKCILERESTHYGAVIAKFHKPYEPAYELLALTSGDTIDYTYTQGLWIDVKVGDTILKKANTLRYLISHPNSSVVDTFGMDFDCLKVD